MKAGNVRAAIGGAANAPAAIAQLQRQVAELYEVAERLDRTLQALTADGTVGDVRVELRHAVDDLGARVGDLGSRVDAIDARTS